MDDGVDPISDDEILYRRVPESAGWYDPATGALNPAAFDPHKVRDATGLSVCRAKYRSIEQAARGQPGKQYRVVSLLAGELRRAGINVDPRPHVAEGFDPSHAELTDLNAANRKSDETLSKMNLLANDLCRSVDGPF